MIYPTWMTHSHQLGMSTALLCSLLAALSAISISRYVFLHALICNFSMWLMDQVCNLYVLVWCYAQHTYTITHRTRTSKIILINSHYLPELCGTYIIMSNLNYSSESLGYENSSTFFGHLTHFVQRARRFTELGSSQCINASSLIYSSLSLEYFSGHCMHFVQITRRFTAWVVAGAYSR